MQYRPDKLGQGPAYLPLGVLNEVYVGHQHAEVDQGVEGHQPGSTLDNGTAGQLVPVLLLTALFTV